MIYPLLIGAGIGAVGGGLYGYYYGDQRTPAWKRTLIGAGVGAGVGGAVGATAGGAAPAVAPAAGGIAAGATTGAAAGGVAGGAGLAAAGTGTAAAGTGAAVGIGGATGAVSAKALMLGATVGAGGINAATSAVAKDKKEGDPPNNSKWGNQDASWEGKTLHGRSTGSRFGKSVEDWKRAEGDRYNPIGKRGRGFNNFQRPEQYYYS